MLTVEWFWVGLIFPTLLLGSIIGYLLESRGVSLLHLPVMLALLLPPLTLFYSPYDWDVSPMNYVACAVYLTSIFSGVVMGAAISHHRNTRRVGHEPVTWPE